MKLRKPCIWAAALSLLVPTLGQAQESSPVEVGEPVSPVSIDVDLRDLPVTPAWRPGQPIREAAKRQYFPLTATRPHAPANKPTAPDELPQLQRLWNESPAAASARSLTRTEARRVDINNPNTGVSPGDPVVEVGTGHVIYGINASGGTSFTVYDKQGTKLAGPTKFASMAPSGDPCARSVSDPIVLFDRLAKRWFMLEMGGTSSANRLCVYVSKTENPLSGGWNFYGFPTPSLPDYPKCGVWNNAYVCTTNETGSGAKVYVFDRERMLAGETARPAQRLTSVPKLGGFGFQALTPATFMGKADKAPPAGALQILARHNDDEAHAGGSANGSQDYIELYSLRVDWNTPSNTRIDTLPRINIGEFNSWMVNYSTFESVPQPGSTKRLDPIREVILNSMVYRNHGSHESIVGNFATNRDPGRTGSVVKAGLRWFELRRTGGGSWTLHQEGTWGSGDSTHVLIGALATDAVGNIGMSYNLTQTSSPAKYASLYYTGRKATDPAGVMTQGENLIVAGAAAETSGRWGDYHQTVVDPVDDCTFWTVGMYRPASGWQTRITDFKFDNCPGNGGGTYSISGKVTLESGSGLAGVTVSAAGKTATTSASGDWTIGGFANGNYTLTPSLSGYTFKPASLSVTVNNADVTNQNFTAVKDEAPGDVLENGKPIANLAGAAGSERVWELRNVPANARVSITTAGGSGDVDLYVSFGQAPTTSRYDCRPYTGGNAESCNLSNPSAGTYYVMLRGYREYSGVTLTGSYAQGGKVFENTNDYTIVDRQSVESPIAVSGVSGNAPAALKVDIDVKHTYIGDLVVDLVAPDGSTYNLHNRAGGSADNIVKSFTVNASSEVANGTWKLRVNDAANGDTGKIDSWKLEF